jgi:hypothetical protein
MTIVLLPLVVVGALLAWAAGARVRHVMVGSVVAGALVLLSAVALGVALSESEDDDDQRAPSRQVDERLAVISGDDEFAPPIRPISGLDADSTRVIEVVGLPADRTARAMQCVADSAQCEPSLPVRADDDGRAVFLFEFTTCAAEHCTLVVVDDAGVRQVSSSLLFGAAVGEGTISLDRGNELRATETVEVSLAGFDEGPVTITYCSPPGPIQPNRCGAPAPEVVIDVGPGGTGTVELPVHVGPVGRDRAECGRGHPCAVAVAGRPDVAAVRLAFAGSADAQPSAAQVGAGVTVAALLLGVAYWLSRRGRWGPPDGDPFAGVTLDDPFEDLDTDAAQDDAAPDDVGAQPATSRRRNDAVPIAVRIVT